MLTIYFQSDILTEVRILPDFYSKIFENKEVIVLKQIRRVLSLILALLLFLFSFSSCINSVSFPAVSDDLVEESTTNDTTKTSTEATTETTEEHSTESTTEEEVVTEKPTQPIKVDSLYSLVTATGYKHNAVGIQVATIVDGKVHATAEYGWAVKDERALNSDTKIRIASLSKTAVGLVVFRLIEEGLIDLDTDISEYLGVEVKNPSYPDIPITLRHLLTHTSGLVTAGYTHSLSQLQEHLQKPSAYTKNKPGKVHVYNNFGYGIVGTICELVTNKSLTTLTNEYFFIPMGIRAAYVPELLEPNEIAALYNEAHTLRRGVQTQLNQLKYTEAAGAGMKLYAGGLTISATDFAKIITLFMNDGVYDGVRYLSTESIELMQEVQLMRPSGVVGQGMPVLLRKNFYDGRTLNYHTGSAYGVYSLYAYDRSTKTGVVVITTGIKEQKDSYNIYAGCGDIARGVFVNNYVE